MTDLPDRKSPAHGIITFNSNPTIIFDTICTKDRKCWLAVDEVHDLLREIWRQADAWKVGRYVIMPDHIHLFAAESGQSIPYENWVRYWKSQFTKLHGNDDHRWQSHHWDTRMRTELQMEEKWEYIANNPVRHKLVSQVTEWPFQGELFQYSWF